MNAYELADDVIHMLESWSKAYPTSMFPDPTQEDIDYINAQNKNLSARFFAHVGRHFINKGFTPAINMLRQQADMIAELEKKLQESAMNYISICSQADEHYARVQELEFENKAFRKELFNIGSMRSCSYAAQHHGFVSPRQAGDDAREYIAEILDKAKGETK